MRHDFLIADAVVHREILQRLHLDDDQVLAARPAEEGRPLARTELRSLAAPRRRELDLRVGRRRAKPGGAQGVPRVVVIAEGPRSSTTASANI